MLGLVSALVASVAFAGPVAGQPGGREVTSALERAEHERQALFERLAPAVVLIETPEGFGSGFFVSRAGDILTNRHVVGKHGAVRVRTRDGKQHRADVVALGAGGVDVALLRIDGLKSPAMRFASTREARVGAWLGSIGHGHGGRWTLGAGILSNAHGDRSGGVLQTQIPLNPGASGGPVFDRQGRVVGVVASGIRDANAINFAITAEASASALPRLRGLANILVVRAPKGTPIFVDGRLVGAGPVAVVVAEPKTYVVHANTGRKTQRRSVKFPSQREVILR